MGKNFSKFCTMIDNFKMKNFKYLDREKVSKTGSKLSLQN